MQCMEIEKQDLQGKERFNRFVESCEKGNFSQLFEWGELKERTGWEAYRLLVHHEGEDVGAISLLKRRIPRTKKCILYAPRGPVVAKDNREVMTYLFSQVRHVARKQNAIFLKIDPDVSVEESDYESFFRELGFVKAQGRTGFEGTQPKFVFRLDITPSVDTLFANLHSKTRYNVRYARKKGVSVRRMEDKKELRAFYTILVETAKRDGFLIRNYEYFSWIYDLMVPGKKAEFYLAEYEGKVIAGTLAMFCGEKSWYLYGASSNAYRNVMPNYLLQWTMIEQAKARGCTLYDFRGVSGDLNEDNPLYGLYRFKKGFNGVFTEFMGEYDLVYQPGWTKAYNILQPLYASGVRRLLRGRK